jgi:hypothetical protein
MRGRIAVFAAILAMPLGAKAADLVSGGNPATSYESVQSAPLSGMVSCPESRFTAVLRCSRRQAATSAKWPATARRKTLSRITEPFSTPCARAPRGLAIRWFDAAVGPGVGTGAFSQASGRRKEVQDGLSEPEKRRNEFSTWKHKQ